MELWRDYQCKHLYQCLMITHQALMLTMYHDFMFAKWVLVLQQHLPFNEN